MKIPIIKKIVEKHSISELKIAEDTLMNELEPKIEIEGEDEGEKLTHILAAIWILEAIETKKIDFTTALRLYTARVRTSIS